MMLFRWLIIFLGVWLFAVPAQAFEVQPATLDVLASPSASTSTGFFLRNTDQTEQTFAFTIQGFVPAGEEGRQHFLPPDQTQGLPSWLFLQRPRITLAPGEQVFVPIFFRPPAEVRAGAYQAAVFATLLDPRRTDGVVLGSRIGVLVFATVDGELRRSLQVSSFMRLSPFLIRDGEVTFSVKVRNDGRIHEIPQASVVISRPWEKVIARLPLQPEGRISRVLPDSTRQFFVRWEKRASGGGWLKGLREEWTARRFGLYEARLVTEEPLISQAPIVRFFVLPWRTSVVILAMLTLLTGVSLRLRKRK